MANTPGTTEAATGLARPRDDELDVFGLTHTGKVRRDNQDHFLFCTVHKSLRVITTSLSDPAVLEIPSQRLASLFMVADGVGGREGGEAASRVTVETMALYATHAMQCYYRTDLSDAADFLAELRAAALASSSNVEARAKAQPAMSKMATTLTMGLVVWPKLYILQVGDSRAYAFGDGNLRLLTRDQTMAQDLVDRGALKPADAERSPLRNILLSAIGRDPTPDVTQHSLVRGELLLLCSDGLSSYVPEAQIQERCRQHAGAEPLCRALMDDALEAGGSDNITVLVARSLPEA